MSKFYEEVNNYTKYKVVEMLIEKHKDKLKDIVTIEEVAEDVLTTLSICGLKFYGDIKHRSNKNEND
jgi:hypothetical protein